MGTLCPGKLPASDLVRGNWEVDEEVAAVPSLLHPLSVTNGSAIVGCVHDGMDSVNTTIPVHANDIVDACMYQGIIRIPGVWIETPPDTGIARRDARRAEQQQQQVANQRLWHQTGML
jgi:hypothetical protein